MRRILPSLFVATSLVALLPAATARADAGVLIPWSLKKEPDPKILSLVKLDVTVRVDHLHARVDIKSIFENHTDQPLEGRYILPLGEHASVEDFSVWQGEERLIGTIVEKQKGKKLFEQIVRQQLDPGLAETDDDKARQHDFNLRVAPIPARGTARVEVTYSEDLQVTSRGVLLTLPWKPRRYGQQKAGALHVDISVDGAYPLAKVDVQPQAFAGRIQWSAAPKAGSTRFAGVLDGKDVPLSGDLPIEMNLGDGGPRVDALAYRDPVPGGRQDISPFGDGTVYRDDRGYFVVRTVVGPAGAVAEAGKRAPRDVAILLDTSLSMQWEKLERSFAALEYFLQRLSPGDRFVVVTFNDEVRPHAGDLMPAGSAETQKALQFVRDSYLGGGTDLGGALASGLGLLAKAPRADAERYLVLISDGNPTLGEIGYRKLGEEFARADEKLGRGRGQLARLFVLGVGDDAAGALLGRLAAAANGYFAWVHEGSDATFLLRTFFDKLGQSSLRDVILSVADLAGVTQIYPPSRPSVFAGSDATFFARYAKAGAATLLVRGNEAQGTSGKGGTVEEKTQMALPEKDASRPWVARGWARYRIDDLLDKIAVDGETPEWVREIIALAKEFHFVTPYTSFIAAPRALLRPRVIQPGDPVLRVRVPSDIREVTAIFPFGLTKALRYLPSENVWETRFIAPTWMKDGSYQCTLVLTDDAGRRAREQKSFVIDSKPPEIHATLGSKTARGGDVVPLTVRADADTRRITARIGDGPSSEITWDPERKASTGVLLVPLDLPTGVHNVTITAEDLAHNVASRQLPLDVVGSR